MPSLSASIKRSPFVAWMAACLAHSALARSGVDHHAVGWSVDVTIGDLFFKLMQFLLFVLQLRHFPFDISFGLENARCSLEVCALQCSFGFLFIALKLSQCALIREGFEQFHV